MHDPTNESNQDLSLSTDDPLKSSVEALPLNASPIESADLIAADFQPIDPRFIPAERMASLVLLICTASASMVALIAMWLTGADQILLVLAAIGLTLLVLLLLWNTFFWPPIEYRHIFWKLSDVGLEIRRGVFWKSEIAIPWARAQHADVSQGPIQRMFEISSLTIHTAGTKNSSVAIEGLAHEQAIRLRDQIIRQRKA